MRAASLEQLARECGFELAGVAPATPSPDAGFFLDWVAMGMAGNMRYLTDHRAEIRRDPRILLPSAKSLVCVAKVYKQADPPSHIAQYAVTRDYHDVMKEGLERLATRLKEVYGEFEYRCFVDTAPLLERTYARMAGIGWIGKNTCLINQELGSWLFLGEILTSLPLDSGTPRPGSLWNVHALHRCLSDPGDRSRRSTHRPRFDALHLVLHDRTSWRRSRECALGKRSVDFRVRHLPGRLPLEPESDGN